MRPTLIFGAVALGLLVTATVARSEQLPEQVKPDRWVVSVAIRAEGHAGPTWLYTDTFATKAQCEAFKASDDWSDLHFKPWAAGEITMHDGKAEIPPAVCVQRKDLKNYDGSPWHVPEPSDPA